MRIITILLIVLYFLSSCDTDQLQQKNKKPNVVLIFSDDMNYIGPSSYGSKWAIQTPNIDQLAEDGFRFTNAYCSAPVCGPSRAGLVTGRYQTSFGHEHNSPRKEGIGLPITEKTFGNRMQDLGYKTGIIGKWHLGGDENVGEEYHPLNRGFDYFYGFYGSMVHFFKSNHIFRGTEQVKDPRYLTDIIAEESCNFIENNKEEPFFLYVAFNAVHTPLEATEEDLAYVESLPGFQQYYLNSNDIKNKEKAKARAAMLYGLDRGIGQINDKLKELDLEENTLVIFTNDNGDYSHYGNGIYSGGKGSTLEGGIRVPFIMKWPDKFKKGQVYDEMVSTLDILPTVVGAGQGQVLPEWDIHGVNLIPYVTQNVTDEPHKWLFWKMANTKAARNGKWKIHYNGKSSYGGYGVPEDKARWLLFNLEADPAETRDLSMVYPEIYKKMVQEYYKWESKQKEALWPHGSSGQMGQWSVR